jgi:hypothetical protein
MPGVLYVPYVGCPRVEKPPAKNTIARMMRMIRSKTTLSFPRILLQSFEPVVLAIGVSLVHYLGFAKHIQAKVRIRRPAHG